MIVQIGLCHRTAGTALLETLQRAARTRPTGAEGALPRNSVVVATCHRLEVYSEGTEPSTALAAWRSWLGIDPAAPLPEGVKVRTDEAAGLHLLRVAAGLESAVLGEDQVLAQLRAAYRAACSAGAAGPLLHRLFHAAFRAGRRVRAETAIAGGSRSLPAAAVNYLDHAMGGISACRVLVLGCGTMGSLAARRLSDRHVGDLLLCNRTWQRATALAAPLGGRAVPWPWRGRALRYCDAVIAAASGGTALAEADVDAAVREGRLRVALDLGMPRNMSVTSTGPPGLEIVDLAALAAHLDGVDAARSAAVRQAEAVVAEELAVWWQWAVARGARRPRRKNGAAAG